MKLSVSGFKSIKDIREFELTPLTLLAGINSSGKSSLIQILLLLKQTIESDSKEILRLNGPYVYAESLTDLLYGKQPGNLKIAIRATADEMSEDVQTAFKVLLAQHDFKEMLFEVSFKVNGETKVASINLELQGCGDNCYTWHTNRLDGKDEYDMHGWRLLNGLEQKRDEPRCKVRFENFIPTYFEAQDVQDASIMEEHRAFTSNAMKAVYAYLKEMLSSMYYLKALRVEPELKKSYNIAVNRSYIDADGQNLQFVYNEQKNRSVDGGEETLAQALVRWLHQELKLSNNIDIKQDDEKYYHTLMLMQKGLNVDLCQVGFGVSQVLPILVQGLLTPKGGTLIVEDPEVHMHPSVQAGLVDFWLEMVRQGKHVLIETHSEHIVTRLRRRIAESVSDGNGIGKENVGLCFVSIGEEGSVYTSIDITDQGAFLTPLPEGFLDTQDEDFKAMLKLRMQK